MQLQVQEAVECSVQRNDSVRTQDSLNLLRENLCILDKLRAKGEIVKYLGQQMSTIDGDMAGVETIHNEEVGRLRQQQQQETRLSHQPGEQIR